MTELNTLSNETFHPSVQPEKNSIVLLHGIFTAPFFAALSSKNVSDVFLTEGRPSLAASKNSAEELLKRKIKPVVISDNMAGFLFYKELVKEIWISYQETNEDGALCPVGSLILAVLGKKHGVPLYLSPSGIQGPMMGKEEDLFSFEKHRVAPKGIKGYVPLLEWLPRQYIKEIIRH